MAIVIPAYNAARTVTDVVQRARRAVPEAAVIVVDDGSSDDTASRARQAGAQVERHEGNQGKGRALATGLAAAAALGGPRFVVTLDADGQHPPEEIPRLLEPLEAGRADLVIGARRRSASAMPPHRRFTNWLSSSLVSRAIGQGVPDSQSGFRAMTREVATSVWCTGTRYEFETEFLFEAARSGWRIGAVEIPTVYAGERSHFRNVSDTMRLARVFARELLFPRTTHHAPRTVCLKASRASWSRAAAALPAPAERPACASPSGIRRG